MMKNPLYLALSFLTAAGLTACGGSGDADDYVVRNIFAVGDQFDAMEDGGAIEGDVVLNDRSEGPFTIALVSGSSTTNGSLDFRSDGSFTYAPDPDFHGKDNFSYQITHTASGDIATALVTINVKNDFEDIEEYGWTQIWGDEFDSEIDPLIWDAVNVDVAQGIAEISVADASTSYLKSMNSVRYGRIETSIQIPAGGGLDSVFKLLPMADLYQGINQLSLLQTYHKGIQAGAQYGLNLTNAVRFNEKATFGASQEFHQYAIEWSEAQIRWYIDGVHVHSVDTLNTWAYSMNGDALEVDQSGPFNQDMQLVFALSADASATVPANFLIDYVRVYSCDPTVSQDTVNCASAVNRSVNNAASDRIESVGETVTPIYTDALEDFLYHYTDEVHELDIGLYQTAVMQEIDSETDRGIVIDVTNAGGDANISFNAPGVAFTGKDVVLNFDMYIDSANTLTEVFDIRMETAWPYMGIFYWNTAELTPDTWVSYSIPVADFIANPFIAPDWLNWIPGVVEGDELPLDPNNVGFLLTIEFHDQVHFQLDNIYLSCISNENCVNGPLAMQPAFVEARHERFEAEDYSAVTGDVQTEETADENGGLNVSDIDEGDVLEYTFEASFAGLYRLDYRVASEGGSPGFNLMVDDQIIETQSIVDTGGWQTWVTLSSSEFILEEGLHTVRFEFVGGGVNVNWFDVVPPYILVQQVEAESFVAQSGLQTEASSDEGGGENIGHAEPGDWAEYTVNIPADGTYVFEYRMASANGSDGFTVSMNGVEVDMQTLEPTGGWQTWISQKAEVELVAGEQTLRLDFVGREVNINWIKITN
ncbi:Glucan endo-1,3-beta-glucosidase A1 [Thalassocella blandensis]|nr:Glucan endo-1,3-beta-glucosidase A1 [Thalassocella blandensis]